VDKLVCGNCRLDLVKAHGRCDSCLRYLNRTGYDAPVDVVEERRAKRLVQLADEIELAQREERRPDLAPFRGLAKAVGLG